MENKIKNKKIFWLSIILTIIILITAVSFMVMFKNINKQKNNSSQSVSPFSYVVPNVPYFGIYNHLGPNARLGGYLGGSSSSSILEILEFWNPGQNDFGSVYYALMIDTPADSESNSIPYARVLNVLSAQGFTTQSLKLSLPDLKKYINPEIRTPLLLSLPISADQPDAVAYYPETLLIGINEKEQTLTFHNYWLGNNYELSFDEFDRLEDKLPIDQRNSYIVIQPKNLDEKLKEIAQRKVEAYPARTSIMQNGEEMFRSYAMGSAGAYRQGLWPQALEYFSNVEKSPNFNEFFPPYFKVMLYYQKAKLFFLKNDLENALVYAQKSVVENHDLNRNFKDWPGFETKLVRPDRNDVTFEPYVILGDILDKKGDLSEALDAYGKAADLMLNSSISVQVEASIRNVELEMAKKGIVE